MSEQLNVTDHYDFYRIVKQPFTVSTQATWDLSKVGKITKNRVVKWLSEGHKDSNMYSGQAAQIYKILTRHFQIPKINIEEQWDNDIGISYESLPSDAYNALTEVYKVERVALRLSDDPHKEHYLRNQFVAELPRRDRGYLRIKHASNLGDFKKAVADMATSGKVAKRIDHAKQAIIDGQQITFTITKD